MKPIIKINSLLLLIIVCVQLNIKNLNANTLFVKDNLQSRIDASQIQLEPLKSLKSKHLVPNKTANKKPIQLQNKNNLILNIVFISLALVGSIFLYRFLSEAPFAGNKFNDLLVMLGISLIYTIYSHIFAQIKLYLSNKSIYQFNYKKFISHSAMFVFYVLIISELYTAKLMDLISFFFQLAGLDTGILAILLATSINRIAVNAFIITPMLLYLWFWFVHDQNARRTVGYQKKIVSRYLFLNLIIWGAILSVAYSFYPNRPLMQTVISFGAIIWEFVLYLETLKTNDPSHSQKIKDPSIFEKLFTWFDQSSYVRLVSHYVQLKSSNGTPMIGKISKLLLLASFTAIFLDITLTASSYYLASFVLLLGSISIIYIAFIQNEKEVLYGKNKKNEKTSFIKDIFNWLQGPQKKNTELALKINQTRILPVKYSNHGKLSQVEISTGLLPNTYPNFSDQNPAMFPLFLEEGNNQNKTLFAELKEIQDYLQINHLGGVSNGRFNFLDLIPFGKKEKLIAFKTKNGIEINLFSILNKKVSRQFFLNLDKNDFLSDGWQLADILDLEFLIQKDNQLFVYLLFTEKDKLGNLNKRLISGEIYLDLSGNPTINFLTGENGEKSILLEKNAESLFVVNPDKQVRINYRDIEKGDFYKLYTPGFHNGYSELYFCGQYNYPSTYERNDYLFNQRTFEEKNTQNSILYSPDGFYYIFEKITDAKGMLWKGKDNKKVKIAELDFELQNYTKQKNNEIKMPLMRASVSGRVFVIGLGSLLYSFDFYNSNFPYKYQRSSDYNAELFPLSQETESFFIGEKFYVNPRSYSEGLHLNKYIRVVDFKKVFPDALETYELQNFLKAA